MRHPNFEFVKGQEIIKKDTIDSLIRFFILCSYSDLYTYNLYTEKNLPFLATGYTMVHCIINMYLSYLDTRLFTCGSSLLHQRFSAGSVIAAGLAAFVGPEWASMDIDIGPGIGQGTAPYQDISDRDIVVMIGALLLISLAFIEGFFSNSKNEKNLELEAILLIAFLRIFFENSFDGSSTEIEEIEKNIPSEEEKFQEEEFEVGTFVGRLVNRISIHEKTGEEILFARIYGCYDGQRWQPTPLMVRCKVSGIYKERPLFSEDVVWIKYDKKDPYFLRDYYIVDVDVDGYGRIIGYELWRKYYDFD